MPIQQIAENTVHIAQNTSLITTLKDWASIIFPVAGAISAVFVWAWGRMQKGVDSIEAALTAHADRNEELFDKVFDEQREQAEKLHKLHGKCEAVHGK